MIPHGIHHVFVMLFALKVAWHWQQLQQCFMVLTQERHFLFVRVYSLPGGCVAYTQVLSDSHYRRNII